MAHSPQSTSDSKEPPQWKTHIGWETNRIDSYARQNLPIAWVLAITTILISLPILFILSQELTNNNPTILLALVFPIAGIFLLYRAIVLTMEYRRFGQVCFEMDPYPGAIGGHIGGQIHIPQLSHQVATGASHINVLLECVYSSMSSGQDRSRIERIEWAEQGSPKIEGAPQGINLLFRFNVPSDLPQADVSQLNDYYFWRITVKAAFSGIDLYRQFNIPAFKSNALSHAVHHDISAQFAAKHE